MIAAPRNDVVSYLDEGLNDIVFEYKAVVSDLKSCGGLLFL
jgi:hypothetical protein